LRLGYALLSAELARPLERIRPPYNVNAAAMVAALATLADIEAVQANVGRIVEAREQLREALSAINWLEPLPSQANFLLCRVHGRDARTVTDALRLRGILVRQFCSSQMADEATREYIRISVGRRRENAAVVNALKQM
jgi:histidinol-phosphate aminotransferase